MAQGQQNSDNVTDKQYASFRTTADSRTAIAIVNPDGSYINGVSGANTSVGVNGSPIPSDSTEVGFKDVSGNLAPGNLDAGGNLRVAASITPATPVDGSTTATLAALNASILLPLVGYYGAGINIPAGLVGSIQAFLSYDGGVTYPQQTTFFTLSTGTYPLTVVNPSGAYAINITGGASHVKVIVSSYTSGSTNVTLRTTYSTTPDLSTVSVSNFPATQPVSGTVTSNIKDSLGNNVYSMPYGTLQTEDIPTQLFIEPFNGVTFDLVNWVAPSSVGGGVTALVAGGQMTIETGTTASGYSKLYSNYSFPPTIPAWIGYSFLLSLPDGASPLLNAPRLFGAVNPAAVPAQGALAQDAAGFELHTDGKLYAVVYAAGVRNVIQDLSAATGNSKQPTDALLHRYIVRVRTDKTFFYIDGLSSAQLVATANNVTPVVQTLPIGFVCAAGTVAPLSSGKLVCQGAYVWDTGKNNRTTSDGTYPWRKQTVKSNGAAAVADDYTNQQNQHVTLTPNTDTTISFSPAVRAYKVLNWDTANRILFSQTAISTNTDATAARVGFAPTASVPNSSGTIPLTTTAIHLRSAAASEITVIGLG